MTNYETGFIYSQRQKFKRTVFLSFFNNAKHLASIQIVVLTLSGPGYKSCTIYLSGSKTYEQRETIRTQLFLDLFFHKNYLFIQNLLIAPRFQRIFTCILVLNGVILVKRKNAENKKISKEKISSAVSAASIHPFTKSA